MRINGFSSQSYPIKSKPRKGNALVDESREDLDGEIDLQADTPLNARPRTSAGRTANLPARQQDMIFHRAMSKNVANALASYLTTAGYVDWGMEVLGLDLHI
ncbi:hypothetical protein [Pseudomonas fluorescens]|uniref:Uncharacterized protein n=1 Tax=Pseudomonas fluorescens TaxID=294 RepID=A0A5E7B5L1_PSEFL|nr:hypothetical protein [Pseudomonas fluorescens]VVN86806.1 hypothetical protein PS691_01534 [Pseudomonas fluorescens]